MKRLDFNKKECCLLLEKADELKSIVKMKVCHNLGDIKNPVIDVLTIQSCKPKHRIYSMFDFFIKTEFNMYAGTTLDINKAIAIIKTREFINKDIYGYNIFFAVNIVFTLKFDNNFFVENIQKVRDYIKKYNVL